MPESVVIVNTSPLLYLYRVGHLYLLQSLYSAIVVPSAVVEELEIGKQLGINVPNIKAIEWIKIDAVSSVAHFPTVIDLGRGEAEVIALGLEKKANLLIIDDQLGRQIAKLYNLKYTGTLGVLVKAKKLGYITSVAPVITELREKGMWLTDKIINEVLKLAEEQ